MGRISIPLPDPNCAGNHPSPILRHLQLLSRQESFSKPHWLIPTASTCYPLHHFWDRLNCELFAGRSRYRERASRPRLSPYEPPAHRVGGSSTLSRAVPSLQQRTAKTPPIFDAVPLQRQDRTWLFRQSIGQAPPGQQTPPRSVERDGCGRRRGLSFTSALALTPPDFCFG